MVVGAEFVRKYWIWENSMEIQEPILKVNDDLYVLARQDDAGFSILVSNKMPEEDFLVKSKVYGFHARDRVVKLCYSNEADIIGPLHGIHIDGLRLHDIMATDWESAAQYIWEHYKQAEIKQNSEGEFKLFLPEFDSDK